MSVKRLFRKKKKGDENEKDSDTMSSDGEKIFQSKVFGLSIKTLAKTLPSKKKNIPSIITQLVGTIEELYIRKQGLFLNSGNKNLIKEKVVELNKKGTINTLSVKDPYTLTTLLKLVLQNLKEPLLTFKLYDQFIKSNDVDTIIKTVKILPQVNLSVLVYIMKFFRNVSLESKFNKMKPNTLASIITPILLRAKKKKRKSHPNALSVIEKMIFYYDKIFLIFEFGDENPKLEDSFSDLISYTTATDPFVNFLDNLDDKVSNFNEGDVVQLTASEIISMSVMKLLKLNLPKKEELMPQIEVSKNNEKNEQKKNNEKNEQKNNTKPSKNSKKNKKSKKKNKKTKKKSKGKQSKKTIQTIGIGDSDTSDGSEEEREIRKKNVRKVRFNLFVECFGDDDEKQEKRKNLLMKRNEEQPEFKEFDKQRKAEEKRYQELMEELKKKEKKEKEEKRKDKKKKDKKKKKGKKSKKSSKKNNDSSDSSNSSSHEDQPQENKKVVKKKVRFAPNIVIFGGEQDLGNDSDEQIKNKDFESLRKLHNQNEFKTLEDEKNNNNNSNTDSNSNNKGKGVERENDQEMEMENKKTEKNEIIEDDPDEQNFDIGMEVSFDDLMNELDFLNDGKTGNENDDEKEEEEEDDDDDDDDEKTGKKMIEKEPIYKIQIETINVELNEEEKFRINLINQILESFNQYKSFKQNFQNLLITEIFKKKINTNEKNDKSYWYGSLLDAGLGLNYQKIILLLRILITEVVVFSKEFQQMNNGQKPLNVKDWNPVLDQIEQIGEFKELLPKISAKYIANIWKWSKNRNKILALTGKWKKEKLELSDPLTLIRKKMQLIKSSLTKVTQIENEIEEISKNVEQDEIEKIKKQVFKKKKFVYDKQRKKISFTMI
ncbi:rho gtpase-activating protein 68f [Anaeramoeba flamelloides]|uniref:Rho gtpase-activating protein 68f n=1 Tax=Anaeramoeba flamelloides TaxID=1746091 RepID=A0ABQ8XNR0_9EUKA|nr:rho gtpase-activating protein 68f [Anaeramoeba flamelloides]